jgi:hypothetical protein
MSGGAAGIAVDPDARAAVSIDADPAAVVDARNAGSSGAASHAFDAIRSSTRELFPQIAVPEDSPVRPRLAVIAPALKLPKLSRFTIALATLRLGNILRRVNRSLHPDSLPQIDKAEMQECFAALEQMKMLMSELEILRLGLK